MTFTNQRYIGDQNGERVLLVQNGVNFFRGISLGSSTGEYVGAGGATFATAAELNQFKANIAYLNYVQHSVSTSSIKTTSSELFTNSGTGQTGNGSGDVRTIPDPRISHRVTFPHGTTNGIGRVAVTGPTHMTQLVIKDNDSSVTFDCYFARFFDGFTTGATNSIEIMLVGATGNSVTAGFIGRTGPFLFETPDGATSQAAKGGIKTLKNVNSFREFVKDQASLSLDGATFNAITYGIAANKTAIFFRGTTDLTELSTISNLLAVNQKGRSADYISSYHVPFLGATSATFGVVGITFNAVTGGSASTGEHPISEFDDALGKLFKVKTDTKLTLDATIKSLNDATTIREITNTSF